MYTIKKTTPSIKRQRMTIKGFKSARAMHEFLNAQTNNTWQHNSEPDYFGNISATADLKPGTYAYAGGQWHNVKSLDPSVLAHI